MRSSAVLVGGAVLFITTHASAVACDALGGPTVLWIENGDTQEPLLKRLGRQLASTSSSPLRIVYRNRPTCELADNFYGARNLAVVASRPLRYVPTPGEDATWDPATSPSPTCDQPAVDPTVDLAIGATFLSSCPTPPAPMASVAVTNGPNQAYGFIVHKGSSQVAITAEEGYLAWGFTGGTGEAGPWLDQNLRFMRGKTASTTLTMSAAIGLDASEMQAANAPTYETTSLGLLNKVATATDQQAAIGVLGTELFDQNRDKVKFLAFRTFGQKYAFFPDSTDAKFDKQNVRDGHYLPWSPTPYIYEVTSGAPAKGNVARVLDLLFGKVKEADVDGLKSVVDSGLVPQCAMKVKRDFDGGDLALFDPDDPCGCFFEKNVPLGATTCTACTDNGPCGTGKCRHGFCEVK